MGEHVAVGTPTQVAHPVKTVVRTVTTYLAAGLLFLAAAIPAIQETIGHLLPEGWQGYLATALLIVGAAQALFTRLMAIAKAQRLLAKIGLGTGVENETIRGEVVEDGEH